MQQAMQEATSEPLERPIGRCGVCKRLTRDPSEIDHPCNSRLLAGQLCIGMIRAAPDPGVWHWCTDCHASGRTDEGLCRACLGEGWFYRPTPFSP